MRIFVSEFITCGALSNTSPSASLLREGRAMLLAVVKSLLVAPDCQVVTTLDRRQSQWLEGLDRGEGALQIELIDHPEAEQIAFGRLVVESDATLVIAPETDGVLGQRVKRVQDLGSASLNCLPEAISLCGDKLGLASHLTAHGIPTIPTRSAELQIEPWDRVESSCVLKPRDGAGSALTFYIPCRDTARWQHARHEFVAAGAGDRAIVQPWIAGQALSVAGLCYDSGDIELFPMACQHLELPYFQYRGGSIPAGLSREAVAIIQDLVRTTCRIVPGLRGYVGFDLVLPDGEPATPVIVEINPRLTTSFVGYQQLCCNNLAARMLAMSGGCGRQSPSQVCWKPGAIHFGADGTSRYEPTPDC